MYYLQSLDCDVVKGYSVNDDNEFKSKFLQICLKRPNWILWYLGNGGIPSWKGDGFCDDVNNNKDFNYDDGDCCGKASVKKNFCVDCTCKCKAQDNLYNGLLSLSYLDHLIVLQKDLHKFIYISLSFWLLRVESSDFSHVLLVNSQNDN